MAEGACCVGDEEEPPLRRRGSEGARREPRPSPPSPSVGATAPLSPAPVERRGTSPRHPRTSCARVLPRVVAEGAISLATSSALLARLSRMRRAGTFPFGRAPPLFGGGGGGGVGARALDAAAASFWSASLALPEGILWWGLGWMGRTLGRTAGGGRRASLGAAAAVLLPLLAAVVVATCTLETATLWYARRAAPWDLAYDVWNNWAAYRGMGASKKGELGAVIGCEVGGAVAIVAGRRACAGRSPRSTAQLWMHLKHRVRGRRKFHENGNNDTATRVEKGLGRQRSACARRRRSGVVYVSGRDRRWQRTVLFLACASAVRFRPDEPYGSASGSTYLEAPVEISKSFVRGWRQRRRMAEAKAKQSAERARIVPAQYTDDGTLKNVAVIFLESARADLFPFDHTTEWAKEKVLPSVLEEASEAAREGRPNTITPFYSALTRNGTASLYLPIKSTSGTTLKSVLATLCGAYPHPSDHTFRERYHGIYQRCLSNFMEKRGASSKFFQSMHTGFDDQFALVDKMGFSEGIYGKEQYDEDHNLTERGDRMAFERLHNANYFGYEDNVLFDTVMDWVDHKAAAKLPFFLVYEAGITHHPFESPPNWPHKTYSENKMVDGFLNEAAYLDDFLGRFLGGFEARNLMTNTLFVLVGDHGVALGDRGVDNLMAVGWEGAFNVGLTFHTGNKIAAERLKKVAEEHRRLNRDAAVGGRSKGTYGSIDVLPTVLDLLDHPDVTSPREGRSLLRPPYSGRTLSLSFINPGSDLVLREGDWVCVSSDKGWGQPSLYDLSVDPKQERPIRLSSGAEKEDQLSSLERWGAVAAKFMALLRNDLDSAYSNGRRCENCTLSVLASSDPLDRWHCSETESESAAESNADSSGSDDVMMFNDWQQKTVVCQPTTSSK